MVIISLNKIILNNNTLNNNSNNLTNTSGKWIKCTHSKTRVVSNNLTKTILINSNLTSRVNLLINKLRIITMGRNLVQILLGLIIISISSSIKISITNKWVTTSRLKVKPQHNNNVIRIRLKCWWTIISKPAMRILVRMPILHLTNNLETSSKTKDLFTTLIRGITKIKALVILYTAKVLKLSHKKMDLLIHVDVHTIKWVKSLLLGCMGRLLERHLEGRTTSNRLEVGSLSSIMDKWIAHTILISLSLISLVSNQVIFQSTSTINNSTKMSTVRKVNPLEIPNNKTSLNGWPASQKQWVTLFNSS